MGNDNKGYPKGNESAVIYKISSYLGKFDKAADVMYYAYYNEARSAGSWDRRAGELIPGRVVTEIENKTDEVSNTTFKDKSQEGPENKFKEQEIKNRERKRRLAEERRKANLQVKRQYNLDKNKPKK